MFGMLSSAGVFGAVANMLVAIYNAVGFGPICKWVDDFFVIHLPDQCWTEADFINLTADIGVPWSLAKFPSCTVYSEQKEDMHSYRSLSP